MDTKEISVKHVVYDHKKYCSDNSEWSKYDKCENLDVDEDGNGFCLVFKKYAEHYYNDSGDPETDGKYFLKCEECIKHCENDVEYESVTIALLRVYSEFFRYNGDKQIFLNDHIGEIGDYERKLAEREGIEL